MFNNRRLLRFLLLLSQVVFASSNIFTQPNSTSILVNNQPYNVMFGIPLGTTPGMGEMVLTCPYRVPVANFSVNIAVGESTFVMTPNVALPTGKKSCRIMFYDVDGDFWTSSEFDIVESITTVTTTRAWGGVFTTTIAGARPTSGGGNESTGTPQDPASTGTSGTSGQSGGSSPGVIGGAAGGGAGVLLIIFLIVFWRCGWFCCFC